MSYKKDSLPRRYYPISAWGYVGYQILFSIPIIGWICLIYCTFSKTSIPRRSFARSYWCWLFIALIPVILAIVFVGRLELTNWVNENVPGISASVNVVYDFVDTAKEKIPGFTPAEDRTVKTTARATVTAQPTKAASVSSPAAQSGVTSAFKAQMDSYEAIVDEYVTFVENTNPNDTSISNLLKYNQLKKRYDDAMDAIHSLNTNTIPLADEAYYVEVLDRINERQRNIYADK